MKVRNPLDSRAITRGIAAASLVAAMVIGIGSASSASAETPLPSTDAAAPVVSSPPATTDTAGVAPDALSSSATAPAAPAAPAKKPTVRQTIAKVGRERGLSQSEIDALLWIAKRESNYHPTSVSSGGCYGLFQLSRGMAGGHPWKDAAWNTKRAIRYMKGRYGGVMKAKAFWMSHHWY